MKKKLFYILSGYAIGSIVASLYNDKKGNELRKDLEKAKQSWKNLKKILFSNFMGIQKRFFRDLEEKVLTEERQEYIDSKKEEVKKMIEKYREEWEELVKTLQKKWKLYASDVSKKVEEFFNEKVEEGEETLKHFGEVVVEEFKDKLSQVSEKIKEKIK